MSEYTDFLVIYLVAIVKVIKSATLVADLAIEYIFCNDGFLYTLDLQIIMQLIIWQESFTTTMTSSCNTNKLYKLLISQLIDILIWQVLSLPLYLSDSKAYFENYSSLIYPVLVLFLCLTEYCWSRKNDRIKSVYEIWPSKIL